MNAKSPTSEAYIIKERYEAASEAESKKVACTCGRTYAVAAAITCDVKILPTGYVRVIDSAEPGRTTVNFSMENKEIEFRPVEGERIDSDTLFARLTDQKWIEENPDHPIAYMFWAVRNYTELVRAIRAHRPLMMFQRHAKKAYVVVGGEREQNAFILEKAGFSKPEIDQILSSMPLNL